MRRDVRNAKGVQENYPDVDIDFQEEMVHFKYFASQLEDFDDTIPGIAIL